MTTTAERADGTKGRALEDGRVVEVHLTWSGRAQQPPWPGHQVYETLDDWVQQVMIPAHEDR